MVNASKFAAIEVIGMNIDLSKLGKKIYWIDRDNLSLTEEYIRAIGRDFIIPAGFADYRPYAQEMKFDDIFFNINDAKKELRKEYLALRKNKEIEVCVLVRKNWGFMYETKI